MKSYTAFNPAIHLQSFLEECSGYDSHGTFLATHLWCEENGVDYQTIPKEYRL